MPQAGGCLGHLTLRQPLFDPRLLAPLDEGDGVFCGCFLLLYCSDGLLSLLAVTQELQDRVDALCARADDQTCDDGIPNARVNFPRKAAHQFLKLTLVLRGRKMVKEMSAGSITSF